MSQIWDIICMCVLMCMHARKHACSGIVVAICASLCVCVCVSGEGSFYLFVCEKSVNTKLVQDRCAYYLLNTSVLRD